MKLFNNSFVWENVLEEVQTKGYYFNCCVDPEISHLMQEELESLNLEFGDHINYPTNKERPYQVRQSHERAYRALSHLDVPVATEICCELSKNVAKHRNKFSELEGWIPNEIGYQRYRDDRDHISPHRDRWSDQLLSVTFTLAGSAWVKIYESYTNLADYKHLNLVDAFLTRPNTVMFLRASGFGSGKQMIHEVMPPIDGERLILNLRARPTILKTPAEYIEIYKKEKNNNGY